MQKRDQSDADASALFWTSRFRQSLTGLYAGVR